MIVRPRPTAWQLLYIIRGSIVPQIASKLLFIMGLAAVVALLASRGWLNLPQATSIPFSLLGLALSVFLIFRNNASYDRWWEARKQLGDLVVQARSLAREAQALAPENRARLVRRTIGFSHALVARLREQDGASVRPWLSEAEWQDIKDRHNLPDAVLHLNTAELLVCLRAGQLGDILYQGLSNRLLAMTGVQAACERIKNTPAPYAYSLLLHRTAWLFCLLLPFGLVSTCGMFTPLVAGIVAYTFFGLDALTDELEEPFGLDANDLPLNAIARALEIDLLDVLGEDALPAPLQPVDFVLQ